MMYSVTDTGVVGEKKKEVPPIGIEPMTFQLVLQMLYH